MAQVNRDAPVAGLGPTLPLFDLPLDIVACIIDLYVKNAEVSSDVSTLPPRGVSKTFDRELQRAVISRLHNKVKAKGLRSLGKIDFRWIAIYLASREEISAAEIERLPAGTVSLQIRVKMAVEQLMMVPGERTFESPEPYVEAVYVVVRYYYGLAKTVRWFNATDRTRFFDQEWICILAAAYLDDGGLIESLLKGAKTSTLASLKRRRALCKLLVKRSALSAIEAVQNFDFMTEWCNEMLYEKACRHGALRAVQTMLENGYPPSFALTTPHKCCLCLAADHCHEEIFNLLLEYGLTSIPNLTSGTNERCYYKLVNNVANRCDVRSFRYLYKLGPPGALNIRTRAIWSAATYGYTAFIHELVDEDLLQSCTQYDDDSSLSDAESVIVKATKYNHHEVAYLLLVHGFLPAQTGRSRETQKLISALTLVDDSLCTRILHSIEQNDDIVEAFPNAIRKGKTGTLREMCRRMTDNNERKSPLEVWGNFSPIHFAVLHSYHDSLRALLEAGLDAGGTGSEAKFNGRGYLGSPLFLAVFRNDSIAARILLENGADPLREHGGKTPLALAEDRRDGRFQDSKLPRPGPRQLSSKALDGTQATDMVDLLNCHIAFRRTILSEQDIKDQTSNIEPQPLPEDANKDQSKKSRRYNLSYRVRSIIKGRGTWLS